MQSSVARSAAVWARARTRSAFGAGHATSSVCEFSHRYSRTGIPRGPSPSWSTTKEGLPHCEHSP
eukprot:1217383-Heterocapsa_arctica.AAC.1